MQDFEEVYAQYYLCIYKYILSLCRDPVLAEEVAQETFYRAFKSIDSFKGNCKISSWLCEIAKNYYYSLSKREHVRRKHTPAEAAREGDIEQQFAEKETAYGIHRALHELQEPYKEVFWLKTFGELSFRQIGDLFGKSESWARVTYYRAKIKIREELE